MNMLLLVLGVLLLAVNLILVGVAIGRQLWATVIVNVLGALCAAYAINYAVGGNL